MGELWHIYFRLIYTKLPIHPSEILFWKQKPFKLLMWRPQQKTTKYDKLVLSLRKNNRHWLNLRGESLLPEYDCSYCFSLQARLHSREKPLLLASRPLVCLPSCISAAPNERISVEFDSGDFYETLSRKFKSGHITWTRVLHIVGSDTCSATTNVTRCCVAMATLSVITILLTPTNVRQQ
jgi:hypothetical protein